MLTVECGVCFSHLFITWTSFLPVFTEKKKKKKISSAHMAAKLLQLTHGADAFFSVNISSSPYFYVLLGSGGGGIQKNPRIQCQLHARARDLSCSFQMSRKNPQSRTGNKQHLFVVLTNGCFLPGEEKICWGSEKIWSSAASQEHTAPSWRMYVYPLTTSQHE